MALLDPTFEAFFTPQDVTAHAVDEAIALEFGGDVSEWTSDYSNLIVPQAPIRQSSFCAVSFTGLDNHCVAPVALIAPTSPAASVATIAPTRLGNAAASDWEIPSLSSKGRNRGPRKKGIEKTCLSRPCQSTHAQALAAHLTRSHASANARSLSHLQLMPPILATGCRTSRVLCDRSSFPCKRCARLGRVCNEPGTVARGRPSKQRLAERARQAAEAAEAAEQEAQSGDNDAIEDTSFSLNLLSSSQELLAMPFDDDNDDDSTVGSTDWAECL